MDFTSTSAGQVKKNGNCRLTWNCETVQTMMSVFSMGHWWSGWRRTSKLSWELFVLPHLPRFQQRQTPVGFWAAILETVIMAERLGVELGPGLVVHDVDVGGDLEEGVWAGEKNGFG